MADEVRVTVAGQERRAMLVSGGASGATADQVQGNVASGATDAGNPVKVGGVVSTAGLGPVSVGQRSDLWLSSSGAAVISGVTVTGADGVANTNISTLASTNSTGTRLLGVAPSVFNGTSWDREAKPNAASRIASAAASVNATSAKGSAGNVFKVFGNNAKASIIYVKIYNKATAPTVGTDTPVLTIPIAASSRFDIDLGGAIGFYLGTGIAYGFTTDAADNGTTALLAADILGFTLTYA